MALVFAQNVIEIAVTATFQGRPHVNVWHMESVESSTQNDEEVVRDFANNWQDHMMAQVTNGYSLQAFDWRSLDPDDSNVGSVSPDSAKRLVGAITGNPASINTCFLIKKQTANRPRGKRDGRCYISGVPETAIDGVGAVLGTVVTAWNTELQAFLDGVSDGGIINPSKWPVVLEAPPESRVPGSTPVTVGKRRITSLVLDPIAGTQRDRMR